MKSQFSNRIQALKRSTLILIRMLVSQIKWFIEKFNVKIIKHKSLLQMQFKVSKVKFNSFSNLTKSVLTTFQSIDIYNGSVEYQLFAIQIEVIWIE